MPGKYILLLPAAVGALAAPAFAGAPGQNMAACYSSLPGLILNVCGILSMFFALAGARDLYRAEMRVKDQPLLAPLGRRIWIYFFLGVTFLVLPFELAIYAQTQHPPAEYAPTCAMTETRNFLRLATALCWYFAALGFYLSHFALGKALRFRGTAAEDHLNREASLLLITSFIVTAVPFAGVALTGVQLW